MRILISFLIGIMLILIGNIVFYSLSEDYRFFLKKLKYSQDVVYDENIEIDDTKRLELVREDSATWSDESDSQLVVKNEIDTDGMKFLDILSGKKEIIKQEDEIPELSEDEIVFKQAFEAAFVLRDVEIPGSLFDITTEYPDDYYEFANKHISLYVFPTKSYEEIKKIFEVLQYELPYSINEVNNFADASFYINLDDSYNDEKVRIVLEYKNRAFWLKIKKDNYNTVKEILTSLTLN